MMVPGCSGVMRRGVSVSPLAAGAGAASHSPMAVRSLSVLRETRWVTPQ